MDFDAWMKMGYDNGWVGPAVCFTHDGVPLSASEEAEFETGDPCVHIVRLYESTDAKRNVEENHSPSVWRATNKGQ